MLPFSLSHCRRTKSHLHFSPPTKANKHLLCQDSDPIAHSQGLVCLYQKDLSLCFFPDSLDTVLDFMNLGHHPTLGNTSKRALFECMHWRFSKERSRFTVSFRIQDFLNLLSLLQYFLSFLSVSVWEMYTYELLEDASEAGLPTGGELHRPKWCFPLSLSHEVTCSQPGEAAARMAAVLAGLFDCSTLSPGVSKIVYLVSFLFLVSRAGSARQFQAGDRQYWSSPSFLLQGVSTQLQWEEWLQVTFTCLFFGLSGDCIAVRIVCRLLFLRHCTLLKEQVFDRCWLCLVSWSLLLTLCNLKPPQSFMVGSHRAVIEPLRHLAGILPWRGGK